MPPVLQNRRVYTKPACALSLKPSLGTWPWVARIPNPQEGPTPLTHEVIGFLYLTQVPSWVQVGLRPQGSLAGPRILADTAPGQPGEGRCPRCWPLPQALGRAASIFLAKAFKPEH